MRQTTEGVPSKGRDGFPLLCSVAAITVAGQPSALPHSRNGIRADPVGSSQETD
jgi:hypothetical protein